MDNWTDRLSEYVDGDLDATSHAALSQHLAECDECSAIVADLRFIAASAASLPDAEPATDLWSGIAAAIGAPNAVVSSGAPGRVAQDPARVIPLHTERVRRRSITLSFPQLAAAAVLLLALGGTAVWNLRPANAPRTIAANTGDANPTEPGATSVEPGVAAADAGDAGDTGAAGDAAAVPNVIASRRADRVAPGTDAPARAARTGVVQTVSRSAPPADLPIARGYDAAVTQLEQAAARSEGRLDPRTTRVLEESMATIDRAIADARAALAADPANAYLHRHLDRTMKQKLDLLQQAAKIDRGGA